MYQQTPMDYFLLLRTLSPDDQEQADTSSSSSSSSFVIVADHAKSHAKAPSSKLDRWQPAPLSSNSTHGPILPPVSTESAKSRWESVPHSPLVSNRGSRRTAKSRSFDDTETEHSSRSPQLPKRCLSDDGCLKNKARGFRATGKKSEKDVDTDTDGLGRRAVTRQKFNRTNGPTIQATPSLDSEDNATQKSVQPVQHPVANSATCWSGQATVDLIDAALEESSSWSN